MPSPCSNTIEILSFKQMPIRFLCRNCQVRVKVPSGTEGRRVKCPRCGFSQQVPHRGHLADPSAASGIDLNSQAEDSAIADALSDSGTSAVGSSAPHHDDQYALPSPEIVDTTETPKDLADLQAPTDGQGASETEPLSDNPAKARTNAPPVPQPQSADAPLRSTTLPPPPPSPHPIADDPSSHTTTDIPLSSKPSDYRPATDRGGDNTYTQVNSTQSTHRANAPTYTELIILAWLFRILAFVVLGVLTKLLLRNVDIESANALRIVVAVVLAFAGGCALWLLSELARAVRDIARNSFKR